MSRVADLEVRLQVKHESGEARISRKAFASAEMLCELTRALTDGSCESMIMATATLSRREKKTSTYSAG